MTSRGAEPLSLLFTSHNGTSPALQPDKPYPVISQYKLGDRLADFVTLLNTKCLLTSEEPGSHLRMTSLNTFPPEMLTWKYPALSDSRDGSIAIHM